MPASMMRILVANEEPEIAREIVDALRGFYEVFVAIPTRFSLHWPVADSFLRT
jgi:hypothetical protein